MARLYADEHFPRRAVEALRRHGHDVVTIQEHGLAYVGTEDSDVLAAATGEGRAVVTINRRHFIRLHRTTAGHAGIIVCTEDLDHAALAGRIHAAIDGVPDLAGMLIRVYRPNVNPPQA